MAREVFKKCIFLNNTWSIWGENHNIVLLHASRVILIIRELCLLVCILLLSTIILQARIVLLYIIFSLLALQLEFAYLQCSAPHVMNLGVDLYIVCRTQCVLLV